MIEWKETRLVPNMDTTHIVEGYTDICRDCMLGIDCEDCDVSIPIIVEDWDEKEVTLQQFTICGIPVGSPMCIEQQQI